MPLEMNSTIEVKIYFPFWSLMMDLSINANSLVPGTMSEEYMRKNLKVYASVNTEYLS